MIATYLITQSLNNDLLNHIKEQAQSDIQQGIKINQIFFYSDAVSVGTLDDYPTPLTTLIDLADEKDIKLTICSAAFQKRDYQLSPMAEQDFSFKGLGQFIAETAHSDIAKLIGLDTKHNLPNNKNTNKNPKNTLLISINKTHSILNLKEILDIVLVCSSYDLSVAFFISDQQINHVKESSNVTHEMAFNMIGDFNIPLFSDSDNLIYGQPTVAANWKDLCQNSQHHYNF